MVCLDRSDVGGSFRERYTAAVNMMVEISDEINQRLCLLEEKERSWNTLLDEFDRQLEAARSRIDFNVGGRRFSITKASATRWGGTFFNGLLGSGRWEPCDDGAFFIDRNPELFQPIVESLRSGKPIELEDFPEKQAKQLKEECDYFMIPTADEWTCLRSVGEPSPAAQTQFHDRLQWVTRRHHAEATFQHFARLVYRFEPVKALADAPRFGAYDVSLLSFEGFLYKSEGEEPLLKHLLSTSLRLQRERYGWPPEEEGPILTVLKDILTEHRVPTSMFQQACDRRAATRLILLNETSLKADFEVILSHARLVTRSLQVLKEDRSQVVWVVGRLAHLWATADLQARDKFRQNEVLMIMSQLISTTLGSIEAHKAEFLQKPGPIMDFLAYFYDLLRAVEWPAGWKKGLLKTIRELHPNCQGADRPISKQVIRDNPMTIDVHNIDGVSGHSEAGQPEAGDVFFNTHRALYQWVQESSEEIAEEFVSIVLQAEASRERGL